REKKSAAGPLMVSGFEAATTLHSAWRCPRLRMTVPHSFCAKHLTVDSASYAASLAGTRIQFCTPFGLGLTDHGLERRLRSDQMAQTNRMSSPRGRKPPRKPPKPVTLSIPVTRPSVSTTALNPKNH